MLRKILNTKNRMLLLSVIVVLVIGVGVTVAFITTQTQVITNLFNPTQVSCEVDETFSEDKRTKSNVAIENTSDIPVYIRAKVIVTWKNAAGDVYGEMPVAGTNYDISFANTGWKTIEGYYYWPQIVPLDDEATEDKAENFTDILISRVETNGGAPEGYSLSVEIIAEAIQADGVDSTGEKAVFDAWGVDPESLK